MDRFGMQQSESEGLRLKLLRMNWCTQRVDSPPMYVRSWRFGIQAAAWMVDLSLRRLALSQP